MTRKQKIAFLKETMTDRKDIVLENLSDKALDSAYRIQNQLIENELNEQVSII